MKKEARPLTGHSVKSRASVTIIEEAENMSKDEQSIPEVLEAGSILEEFNKDESIPEEIRDPMNNHEEKPTAAAEEKVAFSNHERIMEKLTTARALQIELDSNVAEHSDAGNDSGNEADVDTYTDGLTLPSQSQMSGRIQTRDELHREFARKMSEHLTQAALLAGSRDNVSVMVVLLPGCGL